LATRRQRLAAGHLSRRQLLGNLGFDQATQQVLHKCTPVSAPLVGYLSRCSTSDRKVRHRKDCDKRASGNKTNSRAVRHRCFLIINRSWLI
jgi:hypothetical protein